MEKKKKNNLLKLITGGIGAIASIVGGIGVSTIVRNGLVAAAYFTATQIGIMSAIPGILAGAFIAGGSFLAYKGIQKFSKEEKSAEPEKSDEPEKKKAKEKTKNKTEERGTAIAKVKGNPKMDLNKILDNDGVLRIRGDKRRLDISVNDSRQSFTEEVDQVYNIRDFENRCVIIPKKDSETLLLVRKAQKKEEEANIDQLIEVYKKLTEGTEQSIAYTGGKYTLTSGRFQISGLSKEQTMILGISAEQREEARDKTEETEKLTSK